MGSSSGEVRYEARYGAQHADYLSDHKILGATILPTTAALEAATILGRRHFGTHSLSFDNAMHHQAMSFSNSEERIVRLVVAPHGSDKASFRLLSAASRDAEVWHTHMTGTLRKSDAPSAPTFALKEVQARCQRSMPVADFYARLSILGLDYGPSFRGVREL